MGICKAQSINLEEDTTVTNLYDSRQGSVAMADIDNDSDLDLLITGNNAQLSNRKTTLYSNDGLGNFTEITGTGLSNWSELGNTAFADVDGDVDLFMTGYDSQNSGFSKLYLNDGTGTFSEIASNPFEALKGSSLAFLDMDNDNDMDIIISGVNNNDEKKTTLYENDGFGNYSLVNNTSFEGVQSPDISTADSDGDGDVDILLNGMNDSFDNICHLYINDGTGSFNLLNGTPFITTSIGTVDFADFDNDNDMDILVTGFGGAEFAAHIYENQGMNNFILVDSLVKVYFSTTAIGDIDGDNDLDAVIVGISNGPEIVKPRVYKNISSSTNIIDDLSISSLANWKLSQNYPNPFNPITEIQYLIPEISFVTLKVYDVLGNEIATLVNEEKVTGNYEISFNASNLPSGVYLYKLQAGSFVQTKKMILLK